MKSMLIRRPPRWRIRMTLALGASAMCLTAAGCSSTQSSVAGNSSTASAAATAAGASSAGVQQARQLAQAAEQTPTSITQTMPVTSKPPTGKSVIFVRNPEPATTEIVDAAQVAAQSLGWKFSVVNYDPTNPASLQAALLTALSKRPTYVMETGTPQDQFGASVISAYTKAGVKLIVGAAVPFQQTGTVLGDPLSAEAYAQNGKDAADWFISDSDGQGHAVLASVSIYPVYAAFQQGFTGEVKRLCAKCSVDVLNITPAEATGQGILQAAISQIRSTPDIKYAFFDNAQYIDGATAALASAGLTNIKIGGEGPDQVAIKRMQSGADEAWAAISYYYLGYALIDVGVRDITHSTGSELNSIQPRQLLTASNAASVQGEFNQPANALSQFQKLWKVSPTPCTLACG